MDPSEKEVYDTLIALLHSIRKGDVEYYTKHTSEDMTCFEPESSGLQIRGRQFHEFFMARSDSNLEYNFEIVDPTIRVLGDTAYAAYNMVLQRFVEGKFKLGKVSETRIFRRIEDRWIMIHFHRN